MVVKQSCQNSGKQKRPIYSYSLKPSVNPQSNHLFHPDWIMGMMPCKRICLLAGSKGDTQPALGRNMKVASFLSMLTWATIPRRSLPGVVLVSRGALGKAGLPVNLTVGSMPGEVGAEEVAAEGSALPSTGAINSKLKEEELRLLDLHLSSLQENKVSEAHIWKDGDVAFAYLPHDDFEAQLPVIDLAPVFQGDPIGRGKVLEQLRSALEELGFFQVVNHGCPQEIVDEIRTAAHEFFPRPHEEKQRASVMFEPLELYSTITRKYDGQSLRWSENWQFVYAEHGKQEAFLADHVYPSDSDSSKRQALRFNLKEFHTTYRRLGDTILELLAESLGLDEPDVFSRHIGAAPIFRANWYPVCPQPELTLGAGRHTDATILTILHQDDVGGLQVEDRSGKWVGVQPVPGALVVNAGDMLESLTNGRVRSGPHRAVVNHKETRLSLVLFLTPSVKSEIRAAAQLIDEDHPAQFRPFTVGEFFQAWSRKNRFGSDRPEWVGHFKSTLDEFRVV